MTTFKLSTVAAVAAIVVGTSTLGWGLQQALSQTAEGDPFGGVQPSVTLDQQVGDARPADSDDPFPTPTGTVEGVVETGRRQVRPTEPAGQAANTAEAVPPQTMEDSTYDVVPRSETEKKIRAALEERAQMDFFDLPLKEAITHIERRHKFPIVVDERALLDVGVDTSAPITASHNDMSLRSALSLMLRKDELTYIIEDEYMMITTEEEAEQRLSTRIYPVRPQWGVQTTELINAITSTVQGDSWEQVGGPGSIKPLGNNLIISQSYHVHEEIKSFLRQLDRAAQMQPPQAAAAATGGTGYGGGVGPPRSSAGSGYGSYGGTGGYGREGGYGEGGGVAPQRGRRGTPPVIRGGDSTDEGPADDVPSNTQRQ